MCRHRNPLFDIDLGITPKRVLTVDVLHGFFLGVLLVWARITIWKLIDNGVYGNVGTRAETLHAAILVLRSSLMRFYVRYKKEHPREDVTRVADFTTKMVGSIGEPKLKTKGAETWGVALFLISELRNHRGMPDGDRLIRAGECLERIVRIWKAHDWTMPRPAAEENTHVQIIHRSCSCVLFHKTGFHMEPDQNKFNFSNV